MNSSFVKADGWRATAFLTQLGPNECRASLLLENPAQPVQQTIGPETFQSPMIAYEWIVRQAGQHGFEEGQFALRGDKIE